MKLEYAILTYQRPKVLSKCLETLLGNTSIRPDLVTILDDGSDVYIRQALLDFQLQNTKVPINLWLSGRNYGIGVSYEKAYSLMRQSDAEIFGFIESDYVWRKGWCEDVCAVFEASPHTIAIAGCDHPDMYAREKTHDLFPSLMKEQFPEDVRAREFMYQPFELETTRGNIKVQGVSNSCGCMIVHWARLCSLLKEMELEEEYWKWMDRAFNKQDGGDRAHASDQHMSCTLSKFGEKKLLKLGADLTKNFPMLSICDYSISSHRCVGGVNGNVYGLQEGDTFLNVHTWDNKFLETDPRLG